MKKRRVALSPGKTVSRSRGLTERRPKSATYMLQLFVAGTTPRSTQAIANLRAICDGYLPGRYDLEVVDIYQEPGRATAHGLVAVPTLLKLSPYPTRCVVGDLSNREKLLAALNLSEADRSA